MNPGSARSLAASLAILALGVICAICQPHAPSAAAAQGAHGQESPSAQTSVVGGKEATPGKFPWMAFVVDFPGANEITACSGTVLAPRVILTAAHCVFNEETGAEEKPPGFKVVTGTVNWTYPERQVSEVTRLIPYPKFAAGSARDGFGDAALLVLATPTSAPTIAIAKRSSTQLMGIGTHAEVAGWGQTFFEQKNFTESLMWAKTVVESDRCEGLWGRICAIDFPKATSGVCHGDSGGPLFTGGKGGWVEIGITEAGFGKCTTRRPQLFTRTDLIAPWIHSRVRKIEAGH